MEGKAAGYGKNGGGRADGPGSEEGRGLYSTTRDIHSHTHSLTHSLTYLKATTISHHHRFDFATFWFSDCSFTHSPTHPLSHTYTRSLTSK